MAASPPQKLNDIDNQTLVQIVVNGKEILVYPKRVADAVVYYKKKDPPHAYPAKPEQIRWVVTGLKPNQEIRIEGKQGQGAPFSSATFVIPYDCNTILSGVVNHDAGPEGELRWNYNITLLQNGAPLATLDPTIIIKDDP